MKEKKVMLDRFPLFFFFGVGVSLNMSVLKLDFPLQWLGASKTVKIIFRLVLLEKVFEGGILLCLFIRKCLSHLYYVIKTDEEK